MKLNLTTGDGRPIEIKSLHAEGWVRFGLVVMFATFCLFGSKTLINKAIYQQRVISADHKAAKQLDANIKAANTLSSQYYGLFENNNPSNLLGGRNDSSAGAVPPDIDNARLAIDALPTTYDYPALLASVTKIMTSNNIVGPNIAGTDQTNTITSTPTSSPQPVPIKLTLSGSGNYSTVQTMLKDLERSIRPFDVDSLQISGSETTMSFTIQLTTYFQPAKILGITESRLP